MLRNRSILVTGGTGSFGKKFVETIYSRFRMWRELWSFPGTN